MFILSIFLRGVEEPQYLPLPDVRRRHYLIATLFERQMKFKPFAQHMSEKTTFQFSGLYL